MTERRSGVRWVSARTVAADGGLPDPYDYLEALFERSRNPMVILDDARVYVDCNDATGILFGRPREQIIGRRIDDFTPQESHAELLVAWPAFLSSAGVEGSWPVITRSGCVTVDYSATPNFVPGLHFSIMMKQVEPPAALPADDGLAGKSLSPREREILGRIAVGETGPRIATALFISPETVRTHMRNLMVKLGAQTRPHAIALALQRGEI